MIEAARHDLASGRGAWFLGFIEYAAPRCFGQFIYRAGASCGIFHRSASGNQWQSMCIISGNFQSQFWPKPWPQLGGKFHQPKTYCLCKCRAELYLKFVVLSWPEFDAWELCLVYPGLVILLFRILSHDPLLIHSMRAHAIISSQDCDTQPR